MNIQLKRAYAEAEESDGKRILVDRLWPRGVSKEKAQLDEWLKELGPTTELRQWFQHDPEKFPEFEKSYRQQLQTGLHKESFERLKEIKQNNERITLVFGAKEEIYNHVQILKQKLQEEGSSS